MDELKPIVEGFTREPAAFLGGLFSGLLKLNLYDDPVKTWLNQQGASTSTVAPPEPPENGNGPQSITIE